METKILTNQWIHGDCMSELKNIKENSVDLIITSPPYHNLRVYSNDPSDISNCESYEEYYYLLGNIIEECHKVLKPGGKFAIQFEDYNYTIGRDGKRGKESIVGGINDIFLKSGFTLWTEAIWEKYSAQRAMLSDGALWYRNLKNKDTQLAANWGYVYVYKKDGDSEKINGCDITLEEWAEWANACWKISNSGIGHTTPFAEELVRRIIKLWSMPGDTVLDPFAGAGTVNYVAIKNQRNAIGIELKKEFFDIANEKRFNKFTEDDFILKRTYKDVENDFVAEKMKAEEGKIEKQKEIEEKKKMTEIKKSLQGEIKELESVLKAYGLKAKELKEIKEQSKNDISSDS